MLITPLDIGLLIVMLISGLLAMIRGFMREILSIASWGAAALATLYFFPRVVPAAKQYVNNDYVAMGLTIGGIFLATLIVVSVITVRISDKVLDSRIGAFDRTLGFVFGLARGLLIVVVAFVFFDWLVPSNQPGWVNNAKSKVVLKGTGQWLQGLLPEDFDKYLSTIIKKRPKGDDDTPQDGSPDQRSGVAPRADTTRSDQQGYDRTDRASMRQLIDGRTVR